MTRRTTPGTGLPSSRRTYVSTKVCRSAGKILSTVQTCGRRSRHHGADGSPRHGKAPLRVPDAPAESGTGLCASVHRDHFDELSGVTVIKASPAQFEVKTHHDGGSVSSTPPASHPKSQAPPSIARSCGLIFLFLNQREPICSSRALPALCSNHVTPASELRLPKTSGTADHPMIRRSPATWPRRETIGNAKFDGSSNSAPLRTPSESRPDSRPLRLF